MADRVLHGDVLLFARYLAFDIFGLSVMIVVVIARKAEQRAESARSEAERRERGLASGEVRGAEAISAISIYSCIPLLESQSNRVSRHPALVQASFVWSLGSCSGAVLGTAPAKKPISSRRRSAR